MSDSTELLHSSFCTLLSYVTITTSSYSLYYNHKFSFAPALYVN